MEMLFWFLHIFADVVASLTLVIVADNLWEDWITDLVVSADAWLKLKAFLLAVSVALLSVILFAAAVASAIRLSDSLGW